MKGEGVAVVQREKFGGATDREIKLSLAASSSKRGCGAGRGAGCWGAGERTELRECSAWAKSR